MAKLRPLRFVLLLISILLASSIIWYFGRETHHTPTAEPLAENVEVQLTGTRLVGRHNGKRQWEILSAQMQQEGDVVFLQQIDQVVILKDQQPNFFVSTDRGSWHRSTNNLELHDQVEVTGPDSFWLQTTELIWKASEEVLEAPNPVNMKFQGADISAQSMVVENSTGKVTLVGNVRIVDGRQTWRMEQAHYYLDDEVMEILGSALLEIGRDEKGAE